VTTAQVRPTQKTTSSLQAESAHSKRIQREFDLSIPFNSIPVAIRTPGQYIEFDNTRAVQGLPAVLHKMLVFGQRLAGGTQPAGQPVRILSAGQAQDHFGRGSMLASMLAALKNANTYTECWAVAVDDLAAGAFAQGEVTFSGAPTEAGTLNVYIAGVNVRVGVSSGQAAASLATALAEAVQSAPDLPVQASAAGPVVTLTARHKGEVGNGIDVRLNYYGGERTPKGLVVEVEALVGGTGNPDLTAAIASLADEQFHTWVVPYSDAQNLARVEAALQQRFGPMVQREGHAFVAASGTHAQITALGDSRNSPHLTIMGAGKSPTPATSWAAVAAAVDAYEPDPARPRQTLLLPGLLPPAISDRYTREERNLHLFHGVSTTLVDAGGQVLIERLITTYKTSAFGVPDISYLDIETMRTIAYLRLSVRARIALKFPRHKLASDGTRFGPGQPVVTPNIIKAELVALFAQWEEAGLAEGMAQFKRDLIVQRNTEDPNRLDAVIPPDVINQLRVFAAQIQFRL
jgi:phage tail sheath gpL-like